MVSDHGARALQGGFCVNEWLMQEGFLTLLHQPDRVQALEDVRWIGVGPGSGRAGGTILGSSST